MVAQIFLPPLSFPSSQGPAIQSKCLFHPAVPILNAPNPFHDPSDLHACSAIDANHLAVDPLAILGREEADDTGDIDRETDTVERRPASSVLEAELAFVYLFSAVPEKG